MIGACLGMRTPSVQRYNLASCSRISPRPITRLSVHPNNEERRVVARRVVPVAERQGWWKKHPQPNLLDASSLDELVAILAQNTDRLVLVEFYAPWCNSCKSLYPKISQMCASNPQIVAVKVNFEENKELAKKLGVKVLPFFHGYHGSMGRVAAFSSSVTKIQRLKDCISLFGQPYCDVQGHSGQFDLSKSLPEFEKLPTPDDATVLRFRSDGTYDSDASVAAKAAQSGTAAMVS